METYILYDLLTDNPDTGGTWTLNPNSPQTPLNGAFDAVNGTFGISNQPVGEYVFDYTVSNGNCFDVSSATVVINPCCRLNINSIAAAECDSNNKVPLTIELAHLNGSGFVDVYITHPVDGYYLYNTFDTSLGGIDLLLNGDGETIAIHIEDTNNSNCFVDTSYTVPYCDPCANCVIRFRDVITQHASSSSNLDGSISFWTDTLPGKTCKVPITLKGVLKSTSGGVTVLYDSGGHYPIPPGVAPTTAEATAFNLSGSGIQSAPYLIEGLEGGITYLVYVEDATGCEQVLTKSISVTPNPCLPCSNNPDIEVACAPDQNGNICYEVIQNYAGINSVGCITLNKIEFNDTPTGENWTSLPNNTKCFSDGNPTQFYVRWRLEFGDVCPPVNKTWRVSPQQATACTDFDTSFQWVGKQLCATVTANDTLINTSANNPFMLLFYGATYDGTSYDFVEDGKFFFPHHLINYPVEAAGANSVTLCREKMRILQKGENGGETAGLGNGGSLESLALQDLSLGSGSPQTNHPTSIVWDAIADPTGSTFKTTLQNFVDDLISNHNYPEPIVAMVEVRESRLYFGLMVRMYPSSTRLVSAFALSDASSTQPVSLLHTSSIAGVRKATRAIDTNCGDLGIAKRFVDTISPVTYDLTLNPPNIIQQGYGGRISDCCEDWCSVITAVIQT